MGSLETKRRGLDLLKEFELDLLVSYRSLLLDKMEEMDSRIRTLEEYFNCRGR
ncbi:MAG: hypothetical protein OK422_01490 [Thaumarchaeota archaeon]|nr:hypothetical protein [Nitrososphaerota archaeon]